MKPQSLYIVSLVTSFCGCGPAPLPPTAHLPNGKTISGLMSDPELLRAFDMEPTLSPSRLLVGADGSSTSFDTSDEKLVIGRIALTATYIRATGRITGEWDLSHIRR